jgi:hypothetical protein
VPLVAELDCLQQLHNTASGGGISTGTAPSSRHPGPDLPPALLSSLGVALDRRAVGGGFSQRPVARRLLASVCQTALAADSALWPAETHGSAGLGLAIATPQADSEVAVLHRFIPAWRGFARVAEGRCRGGAEREHGAPVQLLMFGDVERARRDQPACGYQRLLVRAGALGNAALLAARAEGLRGQLMSPASGRVSLLLRSGGHGDWPTHLFSVLLGWPNREARSDRPKG